MPRIVVALTLAGLVALTGCSSSDGDRPDVPTVAPATAVPAPAGDTAPPAGVVVGVPRGSLTLALSGPSLAVLGPGGTEILRYDAAAVTAGRATSTTVTTPALGVLIGTGDGSFLGAGPRTLAAIDNAGTVRTAVLDTADPTALARTADGRILVGTVDGHVLVYDKNFHLERTIVGFVRVDALTVSPAHADLDAEQVVVLDRAQSSVTPVDLDNGSLGPALRVGNGATNTTVDHYGRVLVANTRDGEIIGLFGSPLVMRFRHPVAGGPFAVDYDDTRNLLWVSTTGNNKVVAYDLADGEPRVAHSWATVAQPDHIVVDDATGTVFVLSSRDGRLQAIPTAGA